MTLEISSTPSSLQIKGTVDLHTSPILLKALQQAGSVLRLDLSAVTALDNAGVATLIEALRLAESRAVAIHFDAVPDCVRNAWQLAGVTELFDKVMD